MTTKTRPEVIDAHGTVHRYGCPADTFTTLPATMRGWTFTRCNHCGSARLNQTKEN